MIAAVVQVRGGIPSGGASLSAGTIIASPGDAIVTIAEDVAPSGGTAPYTRNLYRSTSGGSKGSELQAAATLPYDDETVTNDTTYYYTLEVVDAVAAEDDTAQVSATPQAAGSGPPDPSGNIVIDTRSGGNMDWQAETTIAGLRSVWDQDIDTAFDSYNGDCDGAGTHGRRTTWPDSGNPDNAPSEDASKLTKYLSGNPVSGSATRGWYFQYKYKLSADYAYNANGQGIKAVLFLRSYDGSPDNDRIYMVENNSGYRFEIDSIDYVSPSFSESLPLDTIITRTMYFNPSTGVIKVWRNDTLQLDASGQSFGAGGVAQIQVLVAAFVPQSCIRDDWDYVLWVPDEVSGPGANEPASMTQAFDEAWDSTPGETPGAFWYTESNPENVASIADATSPSGEKVLALKFPNGHGGGDAPLLVVYSESAGLPANTGHLYARLRLKLSDAWSDNGNDGTKFWWPRTVAPGTNHYTLLTRSGSAMRMGFCLQGAYLGGVDTEYVQAGSLTKGQWYDVEYHFYQGTSAAANDGTVKIWVDGVLVVNQTGVKMLPDGSAMGWDWLAINPTFGYGTNDVPAEQFCYIDHFYASVK